MHRFFILMVYLFVRPSSLLESSSFAFVSDSSANEIYMIDLNTQKTVNTFSVIFPTGISVDSSGEYVFVASFNDISMIYKINSKTSKVDSILTASPSYYVTLGFDNKVYLPDFLTNQYSVISKPLNSPLLNNYPLAGEGPVNIALDPYKKQAFIINDLSQSLSVMSTLTNTSIKEVVFSHTPTNICLSSDGTHAFIIGVTSTSEVLMILDTVTYEVKIIPLFEYQENPWYISTGIAYSEKSKKIFVSGPYNNQVCVIDAETMNILEYIDVGKFPLGLALTKDQNQLCIVNKNDKNVWLIDSSSYQLISKIVLPGAKSPRYIGIEFSRYTPEFFFDARLEYNPVKFQF